MENQLQKQTIDSMQKLYDAFAELSALWSKNEELNFLENEYPFDMSFDELTLEVGYWLDYHKEYLNK